jgi:hypothetical protein
MNSLAVIAYLAVMYWIICALVICLCKKLLP